MEKLGVPPEDRTAEPQTPAEAADPGPTEGVAVPGVSVHATSTPAEGSPVETVTEYACACGETAATERKAAGVKKTSVAILKGDGGTTRATRSPTAAGAVCAP